MRGILGPAVLAVGVVLGCRSDAEREESAAIPATAATAAAATETETRTPTSPPSTRAAAPVETPEAGRRLLEQRGIDPDALSREVGEHMRRRFETAPTGPSPPSPAR